MRALKRLWIVLKPVRKNGLLVTGLCLLLALALFGLIGSLFVGADRAEVGAGQVNRPPSGEHLLGTDSQGRDMLAMLVYGTPQTLKIGFIAGSIGLAIGIVLGFTSGYFGGAVDGIIRTTADVLLTVPPLVVLVALSSAATVLSVEQTALIIASFSWMGPTRAIRSQALSLREKSYVRIARLSGMNDGEIIFREMLPNLLPYLAASFVGAVGSAILASIGLAALSLGPQDTHTLGMIIYWALFYCAFLRGLWWWWTPPVVVIVLLFVSLFLISAGLDRIANPRMAQALRRKTVARRKDGAGRK